MAHDPNYRLRRPCIRPTRHTRPQPPSYVPLHQRYPGPLLAGTVAIAALAMLPLAWPVEVAPTDEAQIQQPVPSASPTAMPSAAAATSSILAAASADSPSH